MEIWKDIEGYEGLYQVSTHGRVKSLARESTGLFGRVMLGEMILNCYEGVASKDTVYYSVNLHKEKRSKAITVHRLVAQTFIPNPDNKPCVNHIDGNKHNNHVENLEWVTYKENTQHAIKTGLITYPPKRKSGKKFCYKGVPVVQYDKYLNPVKRYNSMAEARRETGMKYIRFGIAKLQNGYYFTLESDRMNTRQWDRVRRSLLYNS